MSYSDGSEVPKTEGGLPARLFRNDISPPKSEEAGKDLSACAAQADARTTFSFLQLCGIPSGTASTTQRHEGMNLT